MRKICMFFVALFACATLWAEPITVRLKASSLPSDWGDVAIYYWGGPKIGWPGEKLTEKDGWYSKTFADTVTTVNIIWNNNNNGKQTVNIEGVTSSTCYEISGGSGNSYTVKTVECPEVKPEVILSVEGKTFVDSTLTFSTIATGFSGTPEIVYLVKIGEGAYDTLQGNTYTIAAAGAYSVKVTATYEKEEATDEQTFTAIATPDAITVRLRAVTLPTEWSDVYIHFWGDESSSWPGEKLTEADGWYTKTFSSGCTTMNIIWHNNNGKQTSDIKGVTASTCYENTSSTEVKVVDCNSEPGPGPQPQTKIYYITGNAALVGESLAWKADALAMTDSTHTFTDMAAGTYEMKITDGQWGDGHEWSFDNVDVDASSEGVYASGEHKNIGFIVGTPNNVVVSIANGVITITGTFKPEDTYLMETTRNASVKKVIINGTLYIMREGKMYSVLGQE